MITVDVTKARERLAETVNQVAYRGERVLIQKHGKPVAALVPIDDLELIERMEDEFDIAEAKRIMAEEGNKVVPFKDVKKRLGLK